MANQRLRVIGFIIILVELVALFLLVIGLYVRSSGTGNPVGSIYIFVGFVAAVGGAIPLLFISRKSKNKPKM